MRQGSLGADRRRGAIVLVIFRQVSLSLGELQNFEPIGVGENHQWLCDCVKLALCCLVRLLQFTDVYCKVWRVGRSCG